jgi:hypothetical protein
MGLLAPEKQRALENKCARKALETPAPKRKTHRNKALGGIFSYNLTN